MLHRRADEIQLRLKCNISGGRCQGVSSMFIHLGLRGDYTLDRQESLSLYTRGGLEVAQKAEGPDV